MRYAIVYFFLLVGILPTRGQSPDSATNKLAYIAIVNDRPATNIGELPADVSIEQIINYNTSNAKLSDFKGKILILDFWHQWCGTCVQAFPHLDSLQKAFKNDLVIMPVTFQSKGSATAFFAKMNKPNKPFSLPSIVEDTLLRKMFPHLGDPHEIWIDKDGKVIAITEAKAVNAENIQKILNHTVLDVDRQYISPSFNNDQPLLVNGNGGPDHAFLYRSLFTKFIDSISGENLQRADSVSTRIFVANEDLQFYYREAYGMGPDASLKALASDYLGKRIVVETKHPARFINGSKANNFGYEEYRKFKNNNLFCYELIMPPQFSLKNAFQAMKADLDRFFQVESKVELRSVSCLSLIRTDPKDRLKSISQEYYEYLSPDKLQWVLKKSSIERLVLGFNTSFALPFVIDETKYHYSIDIEINPKLANDLKSLNENLKAYGLRLVEKRFNLPMLVIKDVKDYQH
jgi:thiol-disulfide isomerase/thioredoxin